MKQKNTPTWKEFSKNELTHSMAHYLMAIHETLEEQGYARLVDVAKRLKISKGSLSTSLKTLIKRKLVLEDENKHLSLSEKGQEFAENIHNTHEVFSLFLTQVLDLDPKTADIDSCKIEHLLSKETSDKILQMTKALVRNPKLLKSVQEEITKHESCSVDECSGCIKKSFN